MNQLENIEILFSENGILPNQDDYRIDATPDHDSLWNVQRNAIEAMMLDYLKIQRKDSMEYFSMAPYHHGLNCFWIYIHNKRLLNIDLIKSLTVLSAENHCFYVLDCDINDGRNRYFGVITVSNKYVVFGMLSDDRMIPRICGLTS